VAARGAAIIRDAGMVIDGIRKTTATDAMAYSAFGGGIKMSRRFAARANTIVVVMAVPTRLHARVNAVVERATKTECRHVMTDTTVD